MRDQRRQAAGDREAVAMLLYEHPLSSYAQKVKIALREKGLDFDKETPAGLGPGGVEGPLLDANPRAEVPALIDDEARVFDSTVILEYLEDRYPTPPLLPEGAAARARARMIEDVCDTQYEAINWGLGEIRWYRRAEGALAERMTATGQRQTETMLAWLADHLGTADWFGGDRFGWADLSVAPYLNRSVHYGFGPAAGSALGRWHARIVQRPSVATTFSEFDAVASVMDDAHARLRTPGFRREYRDHRLEWIVKSGGVSIVTEGLEKDNIRFSWPV